MKTINHKKFRTSPLGGYAGVSSYERRKSGGLARFSKDAITFDIERMKQRIQRNDAKRGSPLVLRKQRLKLIFQCLEVLGIRQGVTNEKRQHAREELSNETQRSLDAAQNVIHRRGRKTRLLFAHVDPVKNDDSDGDSSADPMPAVESLDDIKDMPLWPHRRHAQYRNPIAYRLAVKRLAQRVAPQFDQPVWVGIDLASHPFNAAQVAQ